MSDRVFGAMNLALGSAHTDCRTLLLRRHSNTVCGFLIIIWLLRTACCRAAPLSYTNMFHVCPAHPIQEHQAALFLFRLARDGRCPAPDPRRSTQGLCQSISSTWNPAWLRSSATFGYFGTPPGLSRTSAAAAPCPWARSAALKTGVA